MQSVIVRLIKSNSHPQIKELFCVLFVSTKGARIRTKIMSLIKTRPRNTNQLSKEVDSDYKNIQHHLKVLEKNNLVIKTGNRYGLTFCVSALFQNNENVFDEIVGRLKNEEIKFAIIRRNN